MCVEVTCVARAGHPAWVRMKKMRRRRREGRSYRTPAAINIYFKRFFWETSSSLSWCCGRLMKD